MMNTNKDDQINLFQQQDETNGDKPGQKIGRLALSQQQRGGRDANKNVSAKEEKLLKRFPFRLNAMLNDAETHGNEHIFSWLPCGKMFKVHKHKEFATRIMPLYCRHSKYKSFLRQ